MATLPEIAYNIILPIFLVVGAAVVADRALKLDPRVLSRLVIYLFVPFLVFDGIAHSELHAGETGQLVAAAFLTSILMALAAWGVARAARFDRALESAFVLSAVLINAGNYGLPLNEFAFGQAGLDRALVYFVVTVVVSNTLGVFLASRGNSSTRQALLNVLRVPLPYAALLGLAVNVGNVTVPLPLDRAIKVLAQGAIPCMLVVLGMQLSRTSIRGRIGPILMASGMRLVIAPLISVPLVILFGMSGVTRQVAIVQAAMPTAVIAGVLATEFGGDAEFVTATILVSTLLSLVTLTIILSLVM